MIKTVKAFTLPFSLIGLSLILWLLVHIMAILGFFLPAAYLILWIISPKQTPCLLCRYGKEGGYCFFCKRKINKREGSSPSNLLSVILNGVLIFILSAISCAVVFGESQLLSKLGFPPLEKNASFVIPTKGQCRLGEIFPLNIELTGIDTAINAVQADLLFEPSKLEAVSISTDKSFASIFIQKEINNEEGYARLTGGLPNPGFTSDRGIFGTLYFKCKIPGIAKVEYLPTSMVLANDGKGTNVLKDLVSIPYLILPERISEEEEKKQSSTALGLSVLGEETKKTQITFYDDQTALDSHIEEQLSEKSVATWLQKLLALLERTDRFIIEQWQKLLPISTQKV